MHTQTGPLWLKDIVLICGLILLYSRSSSFPPLISACSKAKRAKRLVSEIQMAEAVCGSESEPEFLLCKITNNADQKSDVSLGPNVVFSRQILRISDFSFEPNRKAVQ